MIRYTDDRTGAASDKGKLRRLILVLNVDQSPMVNYEKQLVLDDAGLALVQPKVVKLAKAIKAAKDAFEADLAATLTP